MRIRPVGEMLELERWQIRRLARRAWDRHLYRVLLSALLNKEIEEQAWERDSLAVYVYESADRARGLKS